MKIGFTGTREGMTEYQQDVLDTQLIVLKPDELHLGRLGDRDLRGSVTEHREMVCSPY